MPPRLEYRPEQQGDQEQDVVIADPDVPYAVHVVAFELRQAWLLAQPELLGRIFGAEYAGARFAVRCQIEQAAMLRVQLPHLGAWTARRIEHAMAYSAPFKNTRIEIPTIRPGCIHTFRNYVIRLDGRDAVQEQLQQAGISTTLAYVPPLHLQPAYAELGLLEGSFPIAERACERLLCLPVSPQLRDEQRDYVIEKLLEMVGGQA